MSVVAAQSAGFCFGVKRAVNMAFSCVEEGKRAVTLGELIHNPAVVEDLAARGVRAIDNISQARRGETVIIRSHGVPAADLEEIERRGLDCLDATCPFVARIHGIAAERGRAGDVILLTGNPDHAEVRGIIGHCVGAVFVFRNVDELQDFFVTEDNNCNKRYTLVSQTTFLRSEWKKCVEIAKKVCTNLSVFDTICNDACIKQKEADRLSRECCQMVVVGGRGSSNTARLYETCAANCPTVLVERPQELYGFDWNGCKKVGVTAGASTPSGIIKEVLETMSEILDNKPEEEVSFEEMLDQSFKSTFTGDKVTGVVIGIAPTEVSVNVGTKHTGYIPLHELTDDPTLKPEDIVKVGDELTLKVLRVNDVEGTMVLSKKKVDAEKNFQRVEDAAGTDEILEGVVVEVVKGGVIAVTDGIRVFIPASQATASRNEPLEGLLKQPVRFKILEVNPGRRRAIGSIRAVLAEERQAKEQEFWDTVEVGKHYVGKVKSITSYGAFVDLGGVDGMVHVSELSWMRVAHPSDVVKIGDELEVYVKDIDPENKKISLGYKKDEDNPWEVLKREYPVGSVVKAKIVSMTTFGAFASIIPGIDGLIHISQIAHERIAKPQDVLSVGQEVDVKITDVDFDKHRVSLSIKALLEPEEAGENTAEEAAE